MPIRQPTRTTIRMNDFRNHTFTFPVESVLKPQQGSGKLVISASAGCLLMTSPNHQPTPEQTLDHVLQPDGDWIARGTITLLASDDLVSTSTITIRNPSGETVVLTVEPAPETGLVSQRPTLYVNKQELTFAKTPPGKPTFLVFTISQQNACTPVEITTDAPDQFQLASDSRPAFTPNLSLTPSVTGTYVHIRYLPNKTGPTNAHLIIETPYTDQIIPIIGQRASWLPVINTPEVPGQPKAFKPDSLTKSIPWRWLILLFISGLAVAGYNFRCQLVPDLCQEDVVEPLVAPQRDLSTRTEFRRVDAVIDRREPMLADAKNASRGTRKSTKQPLEKVASSAANPFAAGVSPLETESSKVTKQPGYRSTGEDRLQLPQKTPKVIEQAKPVSTTDPSASEESELERELNRKRRN